MKNHNKHQRDCRARKKAHGLKRYESWILPKHAGSLKALERVSQREAGWLTDNLDGSTQHGSESSSIRQHSEDCEDF